MSDYINWLDGEIAALNNEAALRKASGREDEAAFCRIEMNIDDVCRTLYHVCRRQAKDGLFAALYLKKVDALPPSWQAAREAALAHGDSCRAYIEEIKLGALARCRAKFCELEQG